MYWLLFFIASAPVIWLVISLSVLHMPAYRACVAALGIAAAAARIFFGMDLHLVAEAALDGAALAFWPILFVIITAIFTYNLVVYTGAMKTIRSMLASVSSDRRVLVLLIAWGFGAFMEGMAGFGTAVAIPAGMLVGIGISPIRAVAVCLVANSVPSAYGSIGVPLITMAGIADMDAILLTRYAFIQLIPFVLLCPFLMTVVAGKSVRALRGMVLPCLAAGVGFLVPGYLVACLVGPELLAVTGAVCAMIAVVACVKLFPAEDPNFNVATDSAGQESLSVKTCLRACLPFLLIFVFLLLTSKLVRPVYEVLSSVKSTVLIYSGEGGMPYTFHWINTPGIFILLSAFLGGSVQGARWGEMLQLLKKTVSLLRYTVITIVSVIATAKVMDYSGMTLEVARSIVTATGTAYPMVSAMIGSVGTFITGSATSSCILFGKLQLSSAQAIGAGETLQAWITASNAAGASIGKIFSPQCITIGAAAIGKQGIEGKLLQFAVKVYLPFMLILGALVYLGQALIEG